MDKYNGTRTARKREKERKVHECNFYGVECGGQQFHTQTHTQSHIFIFLSKLNIQTI